MVHKGYQNVPWENLYMMQQVLQRLRLFFENIRTSPISKLTIEAVPINNSSLKESVFEGIMLRLMGGQCSSKFRC